MTPADFKPGGPQNPLPAHTKAVEPKVPAAATGGAGAAAAAFLVVWVIETYLVRDLPSAVEQALYVVVPIAIGWIGAWFAGRAAPHQFRLRPGELAHIPPDPKPKSRHRVADHPVSKEGGNPGGELLPPSPPSPV